MSLELCKGWCCVCSKDGEPSRLCTKSPNEGRACSKATRRFVELNMDGYGHQINVHEDRKRSIRTHRRYNTIKDCQGFI